MPQNGAELTERRKGLHELAEQIGCLRDEFQSYRELFERRVAGLEDWRLETQPVIKTLSRAIWMLGGASVVAATAATVVLWVWMQDHSLLGDVSKLAISTNILVIEMQKADARHERELDRMRGLEPKPPPKETP